MRLAKIGAAVAAVLLVVAGVAYARLTAAEMPPELSEYGLDLRRLRALAASLPGEPPARVRSELVATAQMPRGAMFAGESLLEPQPMVHQSFQVVYPDGRFLVLDAGFDAALHAAMGRGGEHFQAGFDAVQSALGRASRIFVTHEHADHLQGIARHQPPEALAGRLALTAEQLANVSRLDAVGMPDVLRALDPISYEKYRAVAPGAVLVKAPGHTPGSQLLYVRLGDGRELLFVGDVAWNMRAIRELHYRPRLITDFYLQEDRRAVLHEFRRLHDLDRWHPEVRIVVSHDPEQRRALLAEGLLVEGFE